MLLNNLFQIGTLILLLLAIVFVIICLKSGRIGRGILQMLWHLGGFAVVAFVVLTGAAMAAGAMVVAFTFIIKWSLVILVTALISITIKALLHQGGFTKMEKRFKTSDMLEVLKHADGVSVYDIFTAAYSRKSNYPKSHDWFILRLFQEITDFVENGFLTGSLYAGNISKDCRNLQNFKIRTITINKDNIESVYNFNGNENWILIFTDGSVTEIKEINLVDKDSFDFIVCDEYRKDVEFDLSIEHRIMSGFFISKKIKGYLYKKSDDDIFKDNAVIIPDPCWFHYMKSATINGESLIMLAGNKFDRNSRIHCPGLLKINSWHSIGPLMFSRAKNYLKLYYSMVKNNRWSYAFKGLLILGDVENDGLIYPGFTWDKGYVKNDLVVYCEKGNEFACDPKDFAGYLLTISTLNPFFFALTDVLSFILRHPSYKKEIPENVFDKENLTGKQIDIFTFIGLLHYLGNGKIDNFELYQIASFFYSADSGNDFAPADLIFNIPVSEWRHKYLKPFESVVKWWIGHIRCDYTDWLLCSPKFNSNHLERRGYKNRELMLDIAKTRTTTNKIGSVRLNSGIYSSFPVIASRLMDFMYQKGFDVENTFPVPRYQDRHEIGYLYLPASQIYTPVIVSYQNSLEELHIYCPRTYVIHEKAIYKCKNLKRIYFHLIPSDGTINMDLEEEDYTLRISPDAFCDCPNLTKVDIIDTLHSDKELSSVSYELENIGIGVNGVRYHKSHAGFDYDVFYAIPDFRFDDRFYVYDRICFNLLDSAFERFLYDRNKDQDFVPITEREWVTALDYHRETDACAGGIMKFLVAHNLRYDTKVPISDVPDLIYNEDFSHPFMSWLLNNGKITEEEVVKFLDQGPSIYDEDDEDDGE